MVLQSSKEEPKFALDRSVLFLKRLEDSGSNVLMNSRDKEMIQMLHNAALMDEGPRVEYTDP